MNAPGRLAVCSWSLRPGNAADLAAKVRACGLDAVQLAVDPLRSGEWDEGETVRVLRDEGVEVVSGMMGMKGEDYSTLESIRRTGGVRPYETWADNLAAAEANAALAQRLGIGLVTFHAGFLPHDAADSERAVMVDRVRTLAGVFGACGVRVALETGQETADTLLSVLEELPESVGVNFDPANMILYGMGDPITAFTRLSPRVAQVHLKDAQPTATPGTWGTETPLGDGAVHWPDFFYALRESGLRCALSVERESGDRRVEDVRAAVEYVSPMLD